MATIVTRETGPSSVNRVLSNSELDQNFINLNTDKLELAQTYSSAVANGIPYFNNTKVLVTSSTFVFDGTNVGLGIDPIPYTAGNRVFEINGLNSDSEIRLTNTATGHAAGVGGLSIRQTSQDSFIWNAGTGKLSLGANNASVLEISNSGAVTIGGNTVLTSGNYNTYALPLTGGTMTGTINLASGTWAISHAPGNGTFNKHAWIASSTENVIEAALATDVVGGAKLPIILTWRGGYATQGGFKLTGSSTAELGGNTILHAGNYNSYSPTLTGTGASGTWGINITGNAATATSASNIDGVAFNNSNSGNPVSAPNTLDSNGIGYVTNISLFGQTDGALYSQAYSAAWQHQIYGDYRTGQIAVRGENNGTWQAWRTVLDSGNYNSYSPTLTGGGASGTWGINVTGTANNITAYTINQSVGTGNAPTFAEVYTNGWFRNNESGEGLYNQATGNHWYSDSANYWNMGGGVNGSGIRFRDNHAGTIRGYVYYDQSNNIGFLNQDGSWRARVVGGDYWLVEGSSVRAPLFYDSNNTGYYWDGASTSKWNESNQDGWHTFNNFGLGVTGTYSSYRLQTVFAMGSDYRMAADGTATNNMYGIAWSHPNAGTLGGANNLNDHGILIINNGGFRAAISSRAVFSSDVRGTLFYDYNDTGYYCDPNSSSYLHTLLLSGASYFRPQNWIQLDSAYGLYWPNTNGAHVQGNDLSSYGSIAVRGSRSGWRGIHFYDGGNVPHLMFDGSANGGIYFETGGRWASYYSYGNNCWGFGTSSTSSAYNIYCPTGVYSGGRSDGTIFYDANDTGYYCDPNSTSRLLTLNVVGDITVGVGQNSSNIYFTDSDEGTRRMHCNSNRIGFLNDSNGWGSYCGDGGEWYSDQSVRSPIFYDNDNTGYYVDGASTSNLNVLAVQRAYAGYDAGVTGSFSCNNWFRSSGTTGWYNASYEGGIYMEDATWVRVYNSKAFYVANQIAATGNVTAYYSDERLKTNLGNIPNALNAICSLNGFRYVNNEVAKTHGYTSDKVQLGVSAQEVEALFPEVVSLAPFDMHTDETTGEITSKSGNNYKTVAYDKLIPVLIEAIKEQQSIINSQEDRLAKLEKLLGVNP